MFWNPAIVTNAPAAGMIDQSVTFIAPSSELSGAVGPVARATGQTSGSSGDVLHNALLPSLYFGRLLGNGVYAGLSLNSGFGLASEPNFGFAGGVENTSSKIQSFNLTPTIGWRVNDWLSLGAGLQIQYFKATLRLNAPVPPFGAPGAVSLNAVDRYAFGFTAGAIVRPLPGTEIGIGYRSSVSEHLVGDQTATGGPFAALGPIPVTISSMNLPDSVNIGLRQKLTPAVTLAATVEWTNWSRMGTLTATPGIALPAPLTLPIAALPFPWRDGWLYSIGGEYQVRPDLGLRAGFAYEQSPVTDAVRNTRLPDSDRYWLSVGASYAVSPRLALDAGYSYIFPAGSVPVAAPIPGVFTGTAHGDIHLASVGLRWTLGDPAPAVHKD
jgi:long-chain fatty acid transport protein